MKLLTDVDGDEVSLVARAANRRRFLLLKGDRGMDNDLADILEVPWEREGALLDEIRKDGITDDTVEKAVIAAVRLLKGVEDEFSPELIEKLGVELYPRQNRKLNTSPGVDGAGELVGDCDDDIDRDGDSAGADRDGDDDGPDRDGSGSAPKVAADSDGKDKEPDDDADDMGKADFSDDQRKDLASRGQALPDGSYPIRNKSDLSNAIQAYGRAKDKGRAKAWIIRRARALGATSQLPDSWSVSKEDTSDPTETERGTVETHAVPVQKEDGSWDFTGVPDENRPFYEAMIRKADETSAELEKAKEQLAKADDALLTRTMLEKAARLNHVAPADDLAPILKEASQALSPEGFEKLEAILAAAEDRVTKSNLFSEAGVVGRDAQLYKSQDASGKGAYEQLLEKADELIEKSGDLSQMEAFNRALMANPDLYNQYMFEQGMGVS